MTTASTAAVAAVAACTGGALLECADALLECGTRLLAFLEQEREGEQNLEYLPVRRAKYDRN
jgi:hypothetical protein